MAGTATHVEDSACASVGSQGSFKVMDSKAGVAENATLTSAASVCRYNF